MKLAVLISLFIISATTLILAIFGEDNRAVFTVMTLAGHISLVLYGYFYAKDQAKQFLKELLDDVRGRD